VFDHADFRFGLIIGAHWSCIMNWYLFQLQPSEDN